MTDRTARGGERRTVVVGLLADPDLPARFAGALDDRLPDELRRRVDERTDWSVEPVQDPFEVRYPDHHRLMDKARQRVRDTHWDVAICLTDLPVFGDRGPVAVKISEADRVALISLPSLGGFRLGRRLRDVVVTLVQNLVCGPGHAQADRLGSRLAARAGLDSVPAAHGSREFQISRFPTARLLGGMVRPNRPWRLVIGLSTALAGAFAGSAFGVLYSSIWRLATSLSLARTGGVVAAAVLALATWLIVGHNLWERPAPASAGAGERERRLRNAGTAITVGAAAIAFFAALFVIILAAVALVVPPDYVTQSLGHTASVLDYIRIALMATVLGTVAGAVGSGLEDDTTVRRATYSHREQERRRRASRRDE
ncbi:hypothetical protein [Amycolatopsis thermophila]|uniref:5,10-methylene-tetrahydrofolate dehydrogenase/Methenyl tetrahydrofolate cyclohydrolase n=1 Tax=Amycolatopsis thermophila TaxID=206084 RepID=A0ABU0F716_9PSEU|nr:hypothetical protein [Amycolatopsis thermophila]MDQ0382911.1 hypothetical protein [Amycolatopsis thermophila]